VFIFNVKRFAILFYDYNYDMHPNFCQSLVLHMRRPLRHSVNNSNYRRHVGGTNVAAA